MSSWDPNQYNHPGMPPMGKQTPPPLQHPIPQHPIPNFSSSVQQPQPQQQQQSPYTPQQPQQQGVQYGQPMPQQQGTAYGNMYNLGLHDPTAQLGMQFAGSAVAQGTAYMKGSFNRWVDIPAVRHYFNVSNMYVIQKIKLILFPWRHSTWSRSIQRTETGQMDGFKPPREDINSPDLYIPVMALVTYILFCGLAAGQKGSFHPEKLYAAGWTSVAIIISELIFTRLGCYFLSIPFEASMMDLAAYSGYKYVCIIVTDFVKMMGVSKWITWIVFIYTSLSVGFFLLRSMRYVILPDVATGTSTLNPQRKRRMWFLLMIAGLQTVYMFALVN